MYIKIIGSLFLFMFISVNHVHVLAHVNSQNDVDIRNLQGRTGHLENRFNNLVAFLKSKLNLTDAQVNDMLNGTVTEATPSNESVTRRPTDLSNRGARFLGWAGVAVLGGWALYDIVKDGDVQPAELVEVPIAILSSLLFETTVTASEIPLEDYLSNLRVSAMALAEDTPIFSNVRQSLSGELRFLHTNILEDLSLSEEEKESLLSQIEEIQNIVQPLSPPRNRR